MRIWFLNGANLNRLGRREPELYGRVTLSEIEAKVRKAARARKVDITFRQSNFEGDLINWVHEADDQADGIVLNAGGFTRTSVSLLDAIKSVEQPVIELHLTNIYRREAYRGDSLISRGASGIISGFGAAGYELALTAIVDQVRARA